MKIECKQIILVIIVLISSNNIAQENKPLDINSFLELADSEKIYPSVKQIEMLRAVLPKKQFQPAPTIYNRVFWDKITKTKSGKDYLEKANSYIYKLPEVPISDSIYRIANRDGNRGIYKPRYYRTMDKLEHFILAECLENKGRFLSQIETFSKAIMSMKSWLHPNHDDNNNSVLEGKRVAIDLGARKFGSVLALAESLLEKKLPKALRKEINIQLKKRITDSYLESTKYNNRSNKWIKSTSNWNSVCTSGTVLTIITNSKDYDERLLAIGSSINSMVYYVSGFGDDGYCSEGLGYWGYGFSHYLYLAQILYDYTDTRVNLFNFNTPEKLKKVGNFPSHFEIQKERCAPFADGVSSILSKGSNFANVLSAAYYEAVMPSEIRMEEAAEQLIAWQNPKMFEPNKNTQSVKLPNHTHYENFGMVISRGKQDNPLSVAIKGGHNKENHNHSDVGTYTIVLSNEVMAGDIGAPSYRAGSFSKDNPARSSWGHPVPIIDNTLQSNGRAFEGTITSTNFTNKMDRVEIDIKKAYDIPYLTKLIRIMENDKSGLGVISVADVFNSDKPVVFGTAIMTLSEYKVIDNNTVILTENNQKIKVNISSNDGDLKIVDELVPVKYLREGGPAYRIGVNFIKPLNKGRITIKYIPLAE